MNCIDLSCNTQIFINLYTSYKAIFVNNTNWTDGSNGPEEESQYWFLHVNIFYNFQFTPEHVSQF